MAITPVQSKQIPDLVREMENVLPSDFQFINQVLPTEMLKKILEFLDIKSLYFAKLSCKRWKDIIDEFELVNEASSKFFDFL